MGVLSTISFNEQSEKILAITLYEVYNIKCITFYSENTC